MPLLVADSVSLTENLGGFEFTVYWLLDSLAKNDEVFQKNFAEKTIAKIRANDISANKGFFSSVLKIELIFHDKTRYTTILKVPGTKSSNEIKTTDEVKKFTLEENSLADSLIIMHDTECEFYETVAHLIPQIVPKVHKSKRWIKGVHLGCLHMENLSVRGKNFSYFDALTAPQFKNVINWLAYFHSKLLTTNTWQGKFTKQQKIFSEMKDMYKTGVDRSLAIAKTGKEKFRSLMNDKRVKKILYNQEFINYAFFDSYREFKLPMLLVHSDLWSSNIMFKVDEDGDVKDELAALLDWQCAHEGNFLFDFARLMICSLDGDTRREMEETVFDFYVTRLNKYLIQNGGKQVTFTSADVKRTYECMFLAHFGYGIFMFSEIFTRRKKNLGKNKLDSARMDKCTLRNIHILEDVVKLLESGKFNKWL
ncbi:hypothetical protein FO519_001572 [Halicephalobus sp. NKZ332]|nr:hypothetical protein FO519_001572 [Halicephalobus sp. NKZ332]